MGIFQIDADRFAWIDGSRDDPEDLCLHGHVTVRIGDRVLEEEGTVSATALYLLKSLDQDKKMGDPIQMVPCCGHFLIASEDGTAVEIIGCDRGADWSVTHRGDQVELTLPSGEGTRVPLADYRDQVYRFADKVEAFYRSCRPKKLPEEEFDRRGYQAFWEEWRRRRGR